MIVSHKHKFIFIKTEKTAGTSLEIALSEYCGEDDIITEISDKDEIARKDAGYRGAQNYHIPISKYKKIDFAKLIIQGHRASFYNHMPAEEVKDLVGSDIWDGYYKFCFDRNPWDKFVSWYAWKNRNNKYSSMEDFYQKGMAGKVKGFELYTIGGRLAVDDVFKYEEMDVALKTITKKIGLKNELRMPDFIAKGGVRKERKHYSAIVDEKILASIDVFAAREIKLLGYSRVN